MQTTCCNLKPEYIPGNQLYNLLFKSLFIRIQRQANSISVEDESKLYYNNNNNNTNNNNNGRNGSCLTWLATSLEEKRRWLIINASPRGQCSK